MKLPGYIIFAGLLASLIAAGLAGPTLAASGNPAGALTPVAAVTSYYSAINARQYRTGYSLLAPLRRPPYASWSSGYASTRQITIVGLSDPGYRIAMSADVYTCVSVRIVARDAHGRSSSYGGWYLLERAGRSGWLLMTPGSLLALNPPRHAPSRALCSQLIPAPSLDSFGPFVEDWQGHGRLLVLASSGQGIYRYRTYTDCGPQVRQPCDAFVGGTIHAGGYAAIVFTRVAGTRTYGTVVDSVFGRQIGGEAWLALGAHDSATLRLPGRVGPDLLCGRSAPAGYCGA